LTALNMPRSMVSQLIFVLEDASRTPLEDILKIYEAAAKAGADRLVIEDTVGVLRPLSTRYLISRLERGFLN